MRTHQQKTAQLTEFAPCNESLVAEAAMSSFVTPEDQRREAAFMLRLDLLTRRIERMERDLAIAVRTLWLGVTPSLPGDAREAAPAQGCERPELLLETLGRRLANEQSLQREVSIDWLSQGFFRQP